MAGSVEEVRVLCLDVEQMDRGFGFVVGDQTRAFFHITVLRERFPEIANAIDPRKRKGAPPAFVPGLIACITQDYRGKRVAEFLPIEEAETCLVGYELTQEGYKFHNLPTLHPPSSYRIDYSKWRPKGDYTRGLVVCKVKPVTLVADYVVRSCTPAWGIFPIAEYSGEDISAFANRSEWQSSQSSEFLLTMFRERVLRTPVVAIDIESDGERIYQIGIADAEGAKLLFGNGNKVLEAAIAELQQIVKDKLIVGHNILEWDMPILKRHGMSFEETETWDTLQVSLYEAPLRWSYALGGMHRADKDAEKALRLFEKQVLEWISGTYKIPSDLLPSSARKLSAELDDLKPILSLRSILQNETSDITSEDSQARQIAGQITSIVKDFTSTTIVVVPEPWLRAARFLAGSAVVLPDSSFRWDVDRDAGVALCPDLVPREVDNEKFFSVATTYLEAVRLNKTSPDRSLLPPYLKQVLLESSESWERTKKRCITCSNEQCAFYPARLQLTTYPALCEPSFWDYVASRGIQQIVICYYPLIPPYVTMRVEAEQIEKLYQHRKGLLVAARERSVQLDEEMLSTLGFNEDQQRILQHACFLHYTAYDGYYLVVDVRQLQLPEIGNLSIVRHTLSSEESNLGESKVIIAQLKAPSRNQNDSDLPFVDTTITTRYRADFWSTQSFLVRELPDTLQAPLVVFVPQAEAAEVENLFDALGIPLVPRYLTLQRRTELLNKGKVLLHTYRNVYHLCSQVVHLLTSYQLPEGAAVVLPEVPLFPVAEGSLCSDEEIKGVAGTTTEVGSETGAPEDAEEDEEEQEETVGVPRGLLGEHFLKEAAAFLRMLNRLSHTRRVQLVVTDAEVSPLGRRKVSGFEFQKLPERSQMEGYEQRYREVYEKAKVIFTRSPLKPEPIDDVEARLQTWRNLLLPPGADYTPEQRHYLLRVMAQEDGVAVRIPTGGGKSVIFQIPALDEGIRNGFLSVVISPLRALIDDQVRHLWETGFATCVDGITSDLTQLEIDSIFRRVAGGEILLLYVTPERVYTRRFQRNIIRRMLRDGRIGYWILDEAHCVSQWGLDFRPTYLRAARWIQHRRQVNLTQQAGVTPVVFLSATLTAKTIEDLKRIFENPPSEDECGG